MKEEITQESKVSKIYEVIPSYLEWDCYNDSPGDNKMRIGFVIDWIEKNKMEEAKRNGLFIDMMNELLFLRKDKTKPLPLTEVGEEWYQLVDFLYELITK